MSRMTRSMTMVAAAGPSTGGTEIETIGPHAVDAGSVTRASAPECGVDEANAQAPGVDGPGATGSSADTAVIVIHGRCVVPGVSEGEALVTRQAISGWGGIDSRTGTIVEVAHELRGVSFAGRVLLFPGAKGSSGWSNAFHLTRSLGVAPAAMLFVQMSTKVALGAVVTRAPSMTDFDRDPFDVIETGDWVRVDATAGRVEVQKGATGVRSQ